MSDHIPTTQSVLRSVAHRQHVRATELLLGIVTGMVADNTLHDSEIMFLHHWLKEHQDVASVWPGSVIAKQVSDVIADGVITATEREHLLSLLSGMAANNFAETGSAAAEVIDLPYDIDCELDFRDVEVVHTGVFVYGTRSKCEALTQKAGGLPASLITKRVRFLVVGSNVSPAWRQSSYGAKIAKAIELKTSGHPIKVIPERKWFEHITSSIG
jgi:NAD-dependent DNA ligase